MDKRPKLNKNISVKDFRDFYWMKAELNTIPILRDFMADNPNEKRATGVKLWKIKKTMRGDNVYRKDDLDWILN